jgi:glycosyltransferase involved in cell wall biosynthesis
MSPTRILVVSYPQPPIPSVGGNRWLAMAKYLRRRGYDVTTLTTSLMGGMPTDKQDNVVRTKDLAGHALVRRAMRRPALPPPGERALPADTAPSSLLTRVVVPDAYALSWVPFATAAARRLVRERRIECVITTAPYESTHLIPFGLGRARPAWIADFRDGWTFEPHRPPFLTAAQTRVDRRLERAVVRHADRIVVATRPIGEDLRDRLGANVAHVPNGWDPELEPKVPPHRLPPVSQDRMTIVHAGTLSGGWGRDPRPLLRAVEALVRDDPAAAAKLEILLLGRSSAEQARLLAEHDVHSVVRAVGLVPREEALAMQRRADALLLVTAANNKSEATGKLFEYLAAGRPIIALADGNEASRIVRETGTGVTVPPDDVQGIARALRDAAAGGLERLYAPRGTERYRYPIPAEAMSDVIEQATEARAASQPRSRRRRATA